MHSVNELHYHDFDPLSSSNYLSTLFFAPSKMIREAPRLAQFVLHLGLRSGVFKYDCRVQDILSVVARYCKRKSNE